MRSPQAFFRENLPSSKPELWRDIPGAVRRRAGLRLQGWIDPSWPNRPCIAAIGAQADVLIEVIPREVHGHALLQYGVLEYAPTQLVLEYLQAGDTFVDVGANIGYYSLLAAKKVGAKGRVLAFEPVARIRERFQRSVALNGYSNVDVKKEVVHQAKGTIDFFEVAEGQNDGISSAVRASVGAKTVTHPTVPLDDAVGTGPATLLKVDVEGGEEAVFAGAHALFARQEGPAILFESFAPERDHALLQAAGYDIYSPRLTRKGQVCLAKADPTAPSYRHWEAPNFFAVKGNRATAFARRLGERN